MGSPIFLKPKEAAFNKRRPKQRRTELTFKVFEVLRDLKPQIKPNREALKPRFYGAEEIALPVLKRWSQAAGINKQQALLRLILWW